MISAFEGETSKAGCAALTPFADFVERNRGLETYVNA
jgi:hypothetical protein